MADAAEKTGLGRGEWFFVILLVGIGLCYAGWTGYRSLVGTTSPLPSRNVAAEAQAWLRAQKSAPLSAPLQQLLAEAQRHPIAAMPHPLLNKTAPDFTLTDHRGTAWHVRELLAKGQVVLVFYYGYHCDHCVSQLFGLNEDLDRFQEIGAQVIAVSGDPPALTTERFRQYGDFRFPVLSDPGNKIAAMYGVYQPAAGSQPEELRHGTFVLAPNGTVTWTNHGEDPFIDNKALLWELHKMKNAK